MGPRATGVTTNKIVPQRRLPQTTHVVEWVRLWQTLRGDRGNGTMAGDAVGAEPHYWAFISYSHRDAAFGRRLHRRLESYFLPRRLVGRSTAQGVVSRRLVPIFRDREELPAAADLSAEVRSALAHSRSLIVVCSPGAAASKWVSREVELFRALHPDRPVFAAIREGDPAQCFPAALFGTAGERIEPLAADFRTGRDGSHLGLLKLVAGIAGVGLDELVQRDAQRYRQRVTAVTMVALATVLVMGALTAVALKARKEAERQRSEAEGLVEFMLTNLRDRLRGVGRLDVMTAVNERALNYYEDQDIASLPVDSLERRARILHAMGEDDEVRGNLDTALKKFIEAKRTTAALLADAPNDPARIYDHAQSEYWIAYIDWRQDRFEAARAGFERYAALASQLVAMDPANPDWQTEAGDAESNLGTLAMHEGNAPAEALAHFSSALAHFQAALKKKPDDADVLTNIADLHAWLADDEFALGQDERARADRLSQKQVLESLLKRDAKNAEYARDLLGNEIGVARIDLVEGRANDADRRLTTTLADARRYSASDPEDKWLVKEKIMVELFLAKAKLHEKPPDLARARSFLVDCGSSTATDDHEIGDFCAILLARVAAAAGLKDAGALEYLRINRSRMMTLRHSREWEKEFQD